MEVGKIRDFFGGIRLCPCAADFKRNSFPKKTAIVIRFTEYTFRLQFVLGINAANCVVLVIRKTCVVTEDRK